MSNYMDRFSKMQGDKTRPVILEVQVNGIRTREMNPNVPITHDEITQEVIACLEAGAAVIHAHNTDIFLTGEAAYEDYMKSWEPIIRKYPDVLWYSTIAACPDPSLMGSEHMELLIQRAGMRIGCIDPGFANLAQGRSGEGGLFGVVYGWTLDQISRQVKMFRDNGCGIIFGIYEPGYLRTAHYFIRSRLVPAGTHLDLYLFGDYGLYAAEPFSTVGLPPTLESLYYYLHMIEQYDMTALPWFVSIWGAGSMDLKPLMRRVIELGGHLKVGIESHFDPLHKPTNLELYSEVRELAREVGRPIATRAEAARILGV